MNFNRPHRKSILLQAMKRWKLNVNKHDWHIDIGWPEDPSDGYSIFVNKICKEQKEIVYIST